MIIDRSYAAVVERRMSRFLWKIVQLPGSAAWSPVDPTNRNEYLLTFKILVMSNDEKLTVLVTQLSHTT